MKIINGIAAILIVMSNVNASIIYGPKDNYVDGYVQHNSVMSVFMSYEDTNIYRITILNQGRGTRTSGILHEFDDFGNIVKSYPMPFFAVTAPPLSPTNNSYIGLINMYQPIVDIRLKPYTRYGFQWISDRPNSWYFTQYPMTAKERNTGPSQIGNFVETNSGFHQIPYNLIIRIYSR